MDVALESLISKASHCRSISLMRLRPSVCSPRWRKAGRCKCRWPKRFSRHVCVLDDLRCVTEQTFRHLAHLRRAARQSVESVDGTRAPDAMVQSKGLLHDVCKTGPSTGRNASLLPALAGGEGN